MCTAISLGKFAGRNLDVERGYGEALIITPKRFPLNFRKEEKIKEHFSFIGIGTIAQGYPLYFDAVNEHGLYIAGLNYVGNAKYLTQKADKINLAPYELIPYILSRCKSIKEAKYELSRINLIGIPFSHELPCSELHFFIADKKLSITVEPDIDGLHIYDNPVGVLTNNPPFPMQMHNLSNYAGLSNGPLINKLAPAIELGAYSRGMGAIGLPGDLSSQSRFVRAVFHREKLVKTENPCDLFHLLASVEMPKGSLKLGELYEYTLYSSVVDLVSLTYHFRTYDSMSAESISLQAIDQFSRSLVTCPLGR